MVPGVVSRWELYSGKLQGSYLQHFIFFEIYETARVLRYTRQKGLPGTNCRLETVFEFPFKDWHTVAIAIMQSKM
jgi:hypothetical protein